MFMSLLSLFLLLSLYVYIYAHNAYPYLTIIDYQHSLFVINNSNLSQNYNLQERKQANKMCTFKTKLRSNGRPVLEANNTANRTPLLERCNSIPIINTKSRILLTPYSPTILDDRSNPIYTCNSNRPMVALNKSKSFKYMEAPAAGSIAAARREQVSILQEQRKMRIAHYGRTPKSNSKPSAPADQLSLPPNNTHTQRCSFITPNSDPIYVAYHDEEWGVPVHDDELLFELVVLSGAQVGSDWSSVLRKRQDYRDAFSNFDAQIVSKFTEKKMISISVEYCIELSLVRGVVDNSKRILQIEKEYGSFDKYVWGFVNHKTISTQYKWCNKIPVKTSKSEAISKDMVRRGFRQVGPTVIHSFMQAAGLTNDHLITCPRHSQSPPTSPAPAPSL